MNDNEIKIRAGCFEGDKNNPESLCEVPECRLVLDCIWKKEKVPHLGADDNRTEAMTRTSI